jgi:hypothetical protein
MTGHAAWSLGQRSGITRSGWMEAAARSASSIARAMKGSAVGVEASSIAPVKRPLSWACSSAARAARRSDQRERMVQVAAAASPVTIEAVRMMGMERGMEMKRERAAARRPTPAARVRVWPERSRSVATLRLRATRRARRVVAAAPFTTRDCTNARREKIARGCRS